jgi:hypothetical protein
MSVSTLMSVKLLCIMTSPRDTRQRHNHIILRAISRSVFALMSDVAQVIYSPENGARRPCDFAKSEVGASRLCGAHRAATRDKHLP